MPECDEFDDGRSPPRRRRSGRRRTARARALGVSVEAKYTVGEYDILILSAKESNGLETWLTREWLPDSGGRLERARQLHPAEHAFLRRAA